MKYLIIILLAAMTTTATGQGTIFEFDFLTLDGKEKSFTDFKGKKILIVNTASKCGYTPQYAELQELHEKRGDKVAIIGFPANNYGAQEPGSDDEIAKFCKKNFGVTFTMASKVSVNGEDIHPIFKWLCSQENPDFTGAIKWNFEKFLINENGKLIHRYRSGVTPMSKELISAIDKK